MHLLDCIRFIDATDGLAGATILADCPAAHARTLCTPLWLTARRRASGAPLLHAARSRCHRAWQAGTIWIPRVAGQALGPVGLSDDHRLLEVLGHRGVDSRSRITPHVRARTTPGLEAASAADCCTARSAEGPSTAALPVQHTERNCGTHAR